MLTSLRSNAPKRAVTAGVALGLLTTLITVPPAIASMGAGHGDYFWANLFFPFLMLLAGLIGHMPMTLACASLLQYPLYGYLIGNSSKKMKTATSIFIVHVLVTFLSFIWRFG